MGDLAQGEPIKHEVFEKPFKVKPRLTFEKTPNNYRRFPGGDKLPDRFKTWRVQNSGKSYGGVVSRVYGFTDSPDTEVLTAGFNFGKESGAVGVGRHGNFLQWGYSASPSRMTDDGKKFFLNCIVYIHKFDGKAPLIRRRSSARINAIRLALVIDKIKDKSFLERTFSLDLQKKYGEDPAGLSKYYEDDLELIYRDDVFRIDTELKNLGIDSNRKPATLKKLIDLLKNEKQAETARLLLKRYTNESFRTPATPQ